METEAQQRSAEMDSTLFHQTCSDLRQIFDEISDLKKENTEKVHFSPFLFKNLV